MLRLLRPITPAEEWAAERAKIARKRPDLALVTQPRPDPDMFRWWSVSELMGERG
jgi:hypothetical protein